MIKSSILNTLKIIINTTPSSRTSHHIGHFSIFKHNIITIYDFFTYNLACSAAMLTLLHALRCFPPKHKVLIFFQDASLPSYFLPPSDPSLYIPITHTVDDYLQDSPLTMITGFWADLHWKWPRWTDWVQTIQANCEQEFHVTLTPSPTPCRHSSKDMMFTEWEADITPSGKCIVRGQIMSNEIK
jgi:hypothetical protein